MVGRSSPTSRPSRAHSRKPFIASPENPSCRKAQAAPTPEYTLSVKSHPSRCHPPSPHQISIAPSIALSLPASASSQSNKFPKTSTPATAPSAKPTNTASQPQRSVPPCSPPTYGTVIFPSTSPPSRTQPTTSEALTTSPPSPPPTPTSPPAPNSLLLPTPYSLLPASPEPFTTHPGTATSTCSPTVLPELASFTTWFAILSEPSSKPERDASPPTLFPPSSPPETETPPAPQHPQEVYSSSRLSTDARHRVSSTPHSPTGCPHSGPPGFPLAAPPPTSTSSMASGIRSHPRPTLRRIRSRSVVHRPLQVSRPHQRPYRRRRQCPRRTLPRQAERFPAFYSLLPTPYSLHSHLCSSRHRLPRGHQLRAHRVTRQRPHPGSRHLR